MYIPTWAIRRRNSTTPCALSIPECVLHIYERSEVPSTDHWMAACVMQRESSAAASSWYHLTCMCLWALLWFEELQRLDWTMICWIQLQFWIVLSMCMSDSTSAATGDWYISKMSMIANKPYIWAAICSLSGQWINCNRVGFHAVYVFTHSVVLSIR